MANPYIVEFLFRGRAPGDATPNAWHVILGVDDVDGFGQPRHTEQILNVADATAAGYDLAAIVSGINAAALADAEALRAQVAQLEAQLEPSSEGGAP